MKNLSIFVLFISLVSPVFSMDDINSSKTELPKPPVRGKPRLPGYLKSLTEQIGDLSLEVKETQQAIKETQQQIELLPWGIKEARQQKTQQQIELLSLGVKKTQQELGLHSLKIKETQQKLEILSLRAKETQHRSLVYRELRFPNHFTTKDSDEMIKLDSELCNLRKKYPAKYFDFEEEIILQGLRKIFFRVPCSFNLFIKCENFTEDCSKIKMAFIANQEASSSILLPRKTSAELYSKPGYKNLRFSLDWFNPADTYEESTPKGPKKTKWNNLLHKNKSFSWIKNAQGGFEWYIGDDLDFDRFFEAESQIFTFEADKGYIGNSHNYNFTKHLIMYSKLDDPTPFSCSAIFKTSNNLVFIESFNFDAAGEPYPYSEKLSSIVSNGDKFFSYTLDKNKFV